jgi:hypothetical protein
MEEFSFYIGDPPRPCNLRYGLYALAHGKSPDEMLAADKLAFPGACMMEFVFWNSQKLFECQKKHPEYFLIAYDKHASLMNQSGYDEWLKIHYKEV